MHIILYKIPVLNFFYDERFRPTVLTSSRIFLSRIETIPFFYRLLVPC